MMKHLDLSVILKRQERNIQYQIDHMHVWSFFRVFFSGLKITDFLQSLGPLGPGLPSSFMGGLPLAADARPPDAPSGQHESYHRPT